MTSVNTNYSALVALQSLSKTNSELAQVQARINTGLKVATAKDNGAVYAIAQGQRSRVESISSVTDGINRGISTIDTALAAGTKVSDLLTQLKSKAVAAQAADLSTEQRAALQTDFDALRSQISRIVNSATFNGANLVNGNNLSGSNPFSVLQSDIATGSTGGLVDTITGSGATATGAAIPSRNAEVVDTNGLTTTAGTIAANDYLRLTIGSTTYTTQITGTTTINQLTNTINSITGGRATAVYNETSGVFTIQGQNATDLITVAFNAAQDGSGAARVSAFFGVGTSTDLTDTRPTSSFQISGFDLKVGGVGALSGAAAWNIGTSAATALTASQELDTAITTLNSNLATLGSQAKALDTQKSFLMSLSDEITNGIGNLVDADLAKESARLQALQVKQQLGAQALTIANQSPSILLSFFR
jgi:flagellin